MYVSQGLTMSVFENILTLQPQPTLIFGGLAQLARAPDLHSGGQGFESLILHVGKDYIQ